MVQVIDERPFLAVVKEYPHHAEASFQDRVLLLNDLAPAPSTKLPVHNHVANLQIQAPAHDLFYNSDYRNGKRNSAGKVMLRSFLHKMYCMYYDKYRPNSGRSKTRQASVRACGTGCHVNL